MSARTPQPSAIKDALDKACELCRVITKTEADPGCHVTNCEIVKARAELAARDQEREAADAVDACLLKLAKLDLPIPGCPRDLARRTHAACNAYRAARGQS
jgi:hypothetical protein